MGSSPGRTTAPGTPWVTVGNAPITDCSAARLRAVTVRLTSCKPAIERLAFSRLPFTTAVHATGFGPRTKREFDAPRTREKNYNPMSQRPTTNEGETVAALVALGIALAMITNWEVGTVFIVVGSLATKFRRESGRRQRIDAVSQTDERWYS